MVAPSSQIEAASGAIPSIKAGKSDQQGPGQCEFWRTNFSEQLPASGLQAIVKKQTPERLLSGVWNGWDLALSLDARTQNAPSRMAPTNANTAHTARTSSLKARSTSHLLVVGVTKV